MKIQSLVVAFSVSAALVLPAVSAAHNYNYIEGGYIDRDSAGSDDSGLRFAASFDFIPNMALFGEFSDTGKVEQISFGGLFHQNLQPRLDWTVGASLESVDVGKNDDTGLGLRTGLRWMNPDQRLELAPEIRYFEVFGDGNTSLRLGGLYRLTPQVQLQLALQSGDDDRFEAGARYNF